MSNPVNFVLTELDSSVAMDICGQLFATSIPALDVSATAILQVALADVQNLFKFQSNADFNDPSATPDIRYYVDPSGFPHLNAANAMLSDPLSQNPIITADSDGAFPANKMMVAHDFVRYLALKLFNSAYGVELIQNEDDLLTDLRWICGDVSGGQTWFEVLQKFNAVSVNNGSHQFIQMDASGRRYLTDMASGPDNLCRMLMDQIAGAAADRLSNIQGHDQPQPVPFYAGDSISFKLTIAAAPGQEELTNVAPIPPRSYRIKLVIVNGAANNTEVASDEVAYPSEAPAPHPVLSNYPVA
jgi:hypothetical protein